jgi:hypothetical protein
VIKESELGQTVLQVIAIHAVDNIKLSEENIKLLHSIQCGEITPTQAKKLIANKVLCLKSNLEKNNQGTT